MKKLFSMITVIIVVISMTACQENTGDATTVLEQQINDLETENEALNQQIIDLETALAAAVAEVGIRFTVVLSDLDGEVATQTLGMIEGERITVKQVLKGFYNADISESEYGAYINTLDDMVVPYGSYIAIYENGLPSPVGLDDLVIDDDDTFEFKVEWWDQTQQAVYEAIQLFTENQVDNYVSPTFIDYNAFLGCIDWCDDVLTDVQIETYLNGLTPTTVQDYFKAIMIAKELEDGTLLDSYILELLSVVETGPYGQTALGMIAFDLAVPTIDTSDYVASAFSYFETASPYSEGLDAGALGVIALSSYFEDEDIQAIVDEYVNWIIVDQLPSGGVKTRDITWNDTVYPGTENAASISQVIMALISIGIDPNGDQVTTNGNTLVTRLLDYQVDDGSFDWDLTDDIANDASFSTPQAFLALTTYYRYVNRFGSATNPYN